MGAMSPKTVLPSQAFIVSKYRDKKRKFMISLALYIICVSDTYLMMAELHSRNILQ